MSRLGTARWISRRDRLAIYLRDDMTCVWCGRTRHRCGIQLTLDHLVPRSVGGNHDITNIVTSCERCNNVRRNMSVKKFVTRISRKLNVETSALHKRIEILVNTPIDKFRLEAEVFMGTVGGYANAMKVKNLVKILKKEKSHVNYRDTLISSITVKDNL